MRFALLKDDRLKRSDTELFTGTGSPEGVVTAAIGDLYSQKDSGSLWVKESGTGDTGWKDLSAGGFDENREFFSGDGVTTQFTMVAGLVASDVLDVYVNGLIQREGASFDYTTDFVNDRVEFNTAPLSGATIMLRRIR